MERPPVPDWASYFQDIARVVAKRATCPRRQVGAIIVKDRTILSTGYNGSVRKTDHCDTEGCIMENGHCVRTVHAEVNAIIQAAKNGVKIDGAEMYSTSGLCWNCLKIVANAGIKTVYYEDEYPDAKVIDGAEKMGVRLIKISGA